MAADQQTCTLIKDLLSHHHVNHSSPGRALLESRLRLYLFWKKRLLDADAPKGGDAPQSSVTANTPQISEALRRKDAGRSFANRNRRRVRGGAPAISKSSGLADTVLIDADGLADLCVL